MLTLLLAAGNGPAGAAMKDVVASLSGVQLLEHVEDVANLGPAARHARPDIVLFCPDGAGVGLVPMICEIIACSPRTAVVVVSMHNDSQFALRSIQAGARGYMLQDRTFDELGLAIETVMAGGVYLSPGIAGATSPKEQPARSGRSLEESLREPTHREASLGMQSVWQGNTRESKRN